jgi:hypothetical protein
MNIIFAVIRNPEFVINNKYTSFINSLKNLSETSKIVLINASSKEIKLDRANIEVLNTTAMASDLNIYGAISGYLNQYQNDENDYVAICNVENILFTRDPLLFLKHFDKDLYFYSLSHINNESTQIKSDYENFVKTCNFYMGNDFDSLSIGTHFFGGKLSAMKALLLTLFLNVNRNSANTITSQAVLSYVHKHFYNLFKVQMFTNQFCMLVDDKSKAESILDDEELSKKQYAVIYFTS